MSHSIPVFFFLVSNDELPVELTDWHSAENLLSKKRENRVQNGLRTSTTRKGSIWFLRNYYEGNKHKNFSVEQIEMAYTESCAVAEVGSADTIS